MGETTKIAWCDHTFNAWWGCTKVSAGCQKCYADTFSKRVGYGDRLPTIWGADAERRTFGEKHWREPLKWNAAAAKAGKRARVFCSSMADVFEDRRDLDSERAKLWPLIGETPWLDWQLLTKRPENMVELAPASWRAGWPANVWAGTTVEDQERAEKRIPILADVPARVRFLSCEPLLGAVDLRRAMWPVHAQWPARFDSPEAARAAGAEVTYHRQALVSAHARFVDWVIIGGESGPGARPFHLEWARQILRDCQRSGTAAFMKQMGNRAIGVDGGRVSFPGKGDDPSEWPASLRMQEFPTMVAT
jgi:protein gp37